MSIMEGNMQQTDFKRLGEACSQCSHLARQSLEKSRVELLQVQTDLVRTL